MGWALHWVAVLFVVASRGGAAGCDSGCANQNRKNDVTYDGRSLIINDEHKILFSGSIHYPRSTPQMWPDLIAKAKQGGLDVIQTYVFWNVHEPRRLEYDFTGRLDLVKFIKEIQKQGLYACLRIGPFIEAEWNYGGFPFWLHDVRGIVFRTNNEPFKFYMQDFTTKIVNMMKSEKLFASQGGPIILSQIENEYQNVEAAFHEGGPPYVRWAAGMAVNLTTGVPWVMCKQDDAPDPVINACNGLQCGVTFKGPNSDKKPSIWTENWTMQYQVFGDEPRLRSAADIAFHVALFVIMKNGSYINYYMYHGGTNFGRTASSFALTSYYDHAPLDEYGLIRQPQWGHLKDLHAAIKLCVKPLLWGTYTRFPLSSNQMQYAYVFRYNSSSCAAFLVNSDTREDAAVLFQKLTYVLPRKSISILPDCKTVAFNTAKVSTQYSTRSVQSGSKLRSIQQWQEYKEAIPDFGKTTIRAKGLFEHMNTTKDSSDYLWYTTRVPSDPNNPQPMIYVRSLGHLLHAFVNGVQVGSGHGTHNSPGFTKQFQVNLTKGMNNISLLSVMVGLPDAGAYLERRAAGINQVQIQGKDLTKSTWGYKVGLMGEALQIYSELGSKKVHWSELGNGGAPLTWYKTLFNAPMGNAPVGLNLSSMGKGEAWVNGQSIGRYWVSFLTSKENPSQTMYHIPRSFLKSRNNLLVLMEEENNAHPLEISIDTISLPAGPPVDAISLPKLCEHVSEPHLSQTKIQNESNEEDKKLYRRIPQVQLQCPSIRNISNIIFASFGNPSGDCNGYAIGSCHLANSKAVAEEACLGKKRCTISLSNQIFGSDPCPGVPKTLIVHAQCT